MIKKPIICVYQDCPLCGDRGRELKKLIISKGLNVRKVSFASEEGKDLIRTAVLEKGIKTMPFYTDGEVFSTDIEELLGKSVEKPAKKVRKSVKKGGRK